MTKRALFLFSFPFLLATLLTIVGCDLDGSDSGDAELAQIDQAAANAQAESQNSSSSTPATGSSTATSSSSGGGGGFLWKPVSEGNGNLVVLLPSSLRGKVNGADIRKGGSTLEKGRFSGDTHNGNRPHYRFSKPGAGYGTGLTVVASLSGGGTQSWSVPNGSQRVD